MAFNHLHDGAHVLCEVVDVSLAATEHLDGVDMAKAVEAKALAISVLLHADLTQDLIKLDPVL